MNEREAFEAWYEAYCMPSEADWFRRDADDENDYHHAITADAWAAWQARAAIEADRAQRVPDGFRMVSVEMLTRWRDAFAEELGAWDIDPPIHHVQVGFDETSALLASTPAPAQQSGGTEESGLVLDFASRVELSCYDQGSAECMAAVQEILDGKDRGDGVANEPWESIRRRLISLVAPAPAQQEKCPSCRTGSIYACTCPFPTARNQEPPQPVERNPITRNCPECLYSDSWGIADKAFCSQCRPTETGNGSLFYPLNERHHGIRE